jgi:hypothetical protein
MFLRNTKTTIKLKTFFIHERKRHNKQEQQMSSTPRRSASASASPARHHTPNPSRTELFQKSTRKNEEFERFICNGQEAALLDATTSKYIPLTYFVTPKYQEQNIENDIDDPPQPPQQQQQQQQQQPQPQPQDRRSSRRQTHGIADKMPFDTFRLINLQQRGNHAHSLVLFKSRAIKTNPEQIAIFECNGQLTQTEIRVTHTHPPPKEYTDSDSDDDSDEYSDDETGTLYDVTQNYFAPVSPKTCMNYGNDKYNPGYCGIFGIIAMVFHRGFRGGIRPPTAEDDTPTPTDRKIYTRWIRDWTYILNYMLSPIPDEPDSHGCMGTELAAKVQEIIAAHPSTQTGFENAEKEINKELKRILRKK